MPASRRESRPASPPGVYPGLAALLWTVRESLEAVLYKLVMVGLVITDGSPRWLPRADAELRDALEALRSVEVLRAAEVDGIVRAVRPSAPVSLAAVQQSAPQPWPAVFAEHREALRLLMAEIDSAVADNRRALQTASRRTRVPAGCSTRPSREAQREDAQVTATAAYRSALATLATVPQLSLQEFLG